MRSTLLSLLAILCVSCSYNHFNDPEQPPVVLWNANSDIATVAKLAGNGTIIDDIVIEGVVTTSDSAGNFYKQLFITDNSGSMELRIGLYDLYEAYHLGDIVTVRLRELAVVHQNNILSCGYINDQTVSPISTPYLAAQHLQNMGRKATLSPTIYSIDELIPSMAGSLVGVLGYFPEAGKIVFGGEVEYRDAIGHELTIYTAPYASFANELLPYGECVTYGILMVYKDKIQLKISSTDDIKWI